MNILRSTKIHGLKCWRQSGLQDLSMDWAGTLRISRLSTLNVEDGGYEAANERLRATEVCKKWDLTVGPWFAAEGVMPEKIFCIKSGI